MPAIAPTSVGPVQALVLQVSTSEPRAGHWCNQEGAWVCRLAPGTLISSSRDMSDALVTCIVLKPHVTVMDIVSTKMLGQFGFLVRLLLHLIYI